MYIRGCIGWQKLSSEREGYLEIDLGIVPSLVSAVATQGYHIRIVNKYKLAFSRHRFDWFEYREQGETKVSGYSFSFKTETVHFT